MGLQVPGLRGDALSDLGEDKTRHALIARAIQGASDEGYTAIDGTGEVRFVRREDQPFLWEDERQNIPDGCLVALTTVRCYPRANPN